MNILNKFINWNYLYHQELRFSIDESLFDEDNNDDAKLIELIKQFKNDSQVELDKDECYIKDNQIILFFSETGGENESDPDGWSRVYSLEFNGDGELINIDYSQG